MERIFELKQINFLGRRVQILCQNENGPCPLLAIANALLLQNRFTIHADRACISLSDLISEVAEVIVESTAKMGNNDMTRQQLLDSVLMTLPKLAKGLDLNVRFTGVSDYEFTQEISVFDALDIPLVHGWVLDPQDRITAGVIENQSYNHLMFKLVEYKSLIDRLGTDTTTSNPSNAVVSNNASAKSTAVEEGRMEISIMTSSPSRLGDAKGSNKGSNKDADQQEDKVEYVLVSATADSKEGDSTPSSPDKQSQIKSSTTTTTTSLLDFEDDSPVIVPMDVEECKDTTVGLSGADDKGHKKIATPAVTSTRPKPTAEELVILQQGMMIDVIDVCSYSHTLSTTLSDTHKPSHQHTLSYGYPLTKPSHLHILTDTLLSIHPATNTTSHQHTPSPTHPPMLGPIIESFLADTAAQLTYVGLLSLYQTLRERQLAIFFRNDHFSTMFSKEGQLYLLVTDLGYQKESSVVWELLDEIDGDTEYVNDAFIKPQSLSFASPALVLVPPSGNPPVSTSHITPTDIWHWPLF